MIYDVNGNEIGGGGSSSDYSWLKNKSYIAIGDSLVDTQSTNTVEKTYSGTDLLGNVHTNEHVRGYIQEIEDRYGLVATAYGDSGGYFTRKYTTHMARDYSDTALVTIAYGTNDAHYSHPIGTEDSQLWETYAGCIHNLIRKIQMDNPACRVVVLTAPQRLTVNGFGSWTHGDGGSSTPTLEDYGNMAKAVAGRCSVRCADMFHDSGLNQTTLYAMTREGVHPLNNGFKCMSNLLIPILDELFSVSYTAKEASLVYPSTPTSADNTLTEVDLSQYDFSVTPAKWDQYGGTNASFTQVSAGIPLIAGKTYFYTFYHTTNTMGNRTFAINNNSSEITGTTVWGSTDSKVGYYYGKQVVINGESVFPVTACIAVPSSGQYYLWASYLTKLGLDYTKLKYF